MLSTAIKNKISSICSAGKFYAVVYSGKTASNGGLVAPSSVVVNDLAGTVSRSVRQGARDGRGALTNWIFEARIAFDSEVSFSTFLTEELKQVSFTYQNEIRVVMVPGFQTSEPPRQGAHNGTELVITFTVNTRR